MIRKTSSIKERIKWTQKKPTVEKLLKKIEAWLGVQSLYLLTTTAEQFFLRRGYARKTL